MVKNTPEFEKFCKRIIREENIPYEKALAIYDAMHAEAIRLGVITHENILDGIETDLRIARAVNGLKS